jgi:EAL domain-containing protein (putative c-di-GMP-specific phosphodiesterase class I)
MNDMPHTPGNPALGTLVSDGRLADEIRAGLAAGAFEPFFQPIVDMTDGGLVGFEALARWRHPDRGLLLPSEFVAEAEGCGLIRAMDSEILDRAWRIFEAALAARPGSAKPMLLSVNLSTEHLLDWAIVDRLSALIGAGLGMSTRLQFEITETLLINNKDDAEDILDKMKSLGIAIALDDFGTGYSSLVYLHRLPIDCIKIDRSFSEAILRSKRSRAIVSAIIALARSLDIRVVAEGVEEQSVAEELLALGCQFGQGVFFGSPLPAGEIGALLDSAKLKPI